MKLDRYIQKELKEGRTIFDIGVLPNMEVNNNAINRVKFIALKKDKKDLEILKKVIKKIKEMKKNER